MQSRSIRRSGQPISASARPSCRVWHRRSGRTGAQLRTLKTQILEFDRLIMAWHRSNETSKRLDDLPGVGPALATALVASVADPKAFRSGRGFLGMDRART